MSRTTTRSEVITRAWEEKARRDRAAGANTESPAKLLQPSTSLVPGFSVRLLRFKRREGGGRGHRAHYVFRSSLLVCIQVIAEFCHLA